MPFFELRDSGLIGLFEDMTEGRPTGSWAQGTWRAGYESLYDPISFIEHSSLNLFQYWPNTSRNNYLRVVNSLTSILKDP